MRPRGVPANGPTGRPRNAAAWRLASLRATLALVVVLAAGAACTGGDEPERRPPPPAAADGLAWRGLTPAPSERTEVAAAALGRRIHVLGGYTGDGATVASVEVLDTAGGGWSRGPDLPVAVNHAMAVTAGGAVHLFGGYLAGGDPSNAAFRLDGGGWRVLAPMPEGRAAGTAVAVADRVYVAGGIGPGGLAGQMLVYDVAGDRWTAAAGPPTAREHLGGAAFGGRVFTVGGRTRDDGNLAAFEAYDPAADRWDRLPDLPTARGGLAAAAVCTGHVVAVGGEARATFPEAEAYDVRSGAWSALPGLPTPRHGLGVVAVGTTLYTLSGGPRPGLHVAGTTEAIDLSGLGACASP
jgi:hypothetical protein